MFIVRREDLYSIETNESKIILTQEYKKKFLDEQFLPILLYIENKGLHLGIPSVIDGWDASFIYRHLSTEHYRLGRPAEELCLFIYSRLKSNQAIALEYEKLFKL